MGNLYSKKDECDTNSRDELMTRKATLEMAKTLRYVELFEETRLMANQKKKGHSFVKQYEDEKDCNACRDKDWQENHYWSQGTERGNGAQGVIISSYHLDFFRHKLASIAKSSSTQPVRPPFTVHETAGMHKSTQLCESTNSQPSWFTFEQPMNGLLEIPRDGVVRDFLVDIKNRNPESFEDCDSLSDVLGRLTPDDLPNDHEICDFARAFWTGLVENALKPAFMQLHEHWKGSDNEETELVLGFGNVRRVFAVLKNGSNKEESFSETKMINGPVIEVVVDTTRVEEDGSIILHPKKSGRVQLNTEVLNALITCGGGNTKIVSELREMLADCKPTDLAPGNPESFLPFLNKASTLCWNGTVKASNDPSVHVPPADPDAMVVTDSWILFKRAKKSSAASRDAAALAEALELGTLKLGDAAFLLTQGPGSFDERPKATKEDGRNDFPLPLCASRAQRNMISKFYSQDQPVLLVQGPPGYVLDCFVGMTWK